MVLSVRSKPSRQYPQGEILWEQVDPWLEVITSAGALARFAVHVGLSISTLRARRSKLSLPALKRGRPIQQELTGYELSIRSKLEGGMSKGAVARELGVSRQAVGQAMSRAAGKTGEVCTTCEGVGVVECPRTYIDDWGERVFEACNSSPHFHVCPKCEGK